MHNANKTMQEYIRSFMYIIYVMPSLRNAIVVIVSATCNSLVVSCFNTDPCYTYQYSTCNGSKEGQDLCTCSDIKVISTAIIFMYSSTQQNTKKHSTHTDELEYLHN